jgi:hypothetical protein
MKKATLQTCSLVGLVVLIAAVSAKAQTQYRMQVPFDFTVGDKSYEAGNYFVDVLSSQTAHKIVAIRDAKRGRSYMATVRVGEDHSKIRIATLIFRRSEAQFYLARISTPTFVAILTPKSRAKEPLARDQKVKYETVAMTPKN